MMMNQKIPAWLIFMLLSMVAAHNSDDYHNSEDYYNSETYEDDLTGEGTAPGAGLSPLDCTASDISLGLVASCSCRGANNACPACHLQKSGLVNCYAPCDSDNRECSSCNIYYGGLCKCLQIMAGLLPGSTCFGNRPWLGPGMGLPPVWILGGSGNLGERLISSTVLNTGIDQLAEMPDNNGGWTLGFQHIDTLTQALSINSRLTRSRNEIHLHLCDKSSGPPAILAQKDPAMFATFEPIGTWYCKATKPSKAVLPNTDAWLTSPSTDYLAWLATNPPVDRNNLGFALLTDTHNNYLWQCITTTTQVTEGIFCK
ncbi:hypothetical protein NQZ79_g6231 [Umbelopsis isabellina]|nr:hypothetical protein NQZ79_g6231 [Umbelopsis isabellina]